ncbi:MAG: ArsR family transcriptional regulator [Bacteroidetes bacterium]|nr:ArsR family transcriptional regulator [Bacteroidota bacterium]
MLEALITSKTRIKLLLKFFLNSNSSSYLRNLETEFGESSNAIRLELNKFEQAGLLNSELDGNKKRFRANTHHPLFNDIHNILLKHLGFDKIVETVIDQLGNLDKVFVTGAFARGTDHQVIDLIFVGNEINKNYLLKLVDKVERLISRKIRYMVMGSDEFRMYEAGLGDEEVLLLWDKEK